jgi:hypothetical protein
MKSKTDQSTNNTPLTTDADIGQLQTENAKLKEQLRLRDAHEDLTHRLKKAGAKTPKLLLAAAKHALKFTAEGMLENAGEVVEDLLGRFPEQFGHHTSAPPHISIDAGSGRTAKPTLTREALAKMKPAEIAKLDWNEVRRVLSN